MEHQGIKIEFIGQIELLYDRGNHHEFKCLSKALARAGDLIKNTSYPFEFPNVEKQFEVYAGSNVRLRYFLRATISRRMSDITREVDIAVHTLSSYPDVNNPIKMEVGIEDCLHIEFEYNKSKYHLRDTIVGKIYFLLVRIKIKHMEIAILKKESTGTGPNMFTDNETIVKFEIMDGAPVKGESIPIRLLLAGFNLTPSMRDIYKKFSVKYFLNLVLMDTEDRRYFKQQEITLWRKADIPRYHHTHSQQHYAITGASSNMPHGPSDSSNLVVAGNVFSPTDDIDDNVEGVGDDGNVTDDIHSQTDTRGKMGLFTRESPQQEFEEMSQERHQDLKEDGDKNGQRQQENILPHLQTENLKPSERGIGDGAVSTINTSSVILSSTTPPPLPKSTSETVLEILQVDKRQSNGGTENEILHETEHKADKINIGLTEDDSKSSAVKHITSQMANSSITSTSDLLFINDDA